MAKKVRIELDRGGIKALLQSAEVQAACQAQADACMARSGGGYASAAHKSDQRVIVNVWPDSAEARRENAKNNTLLKALRRNGGGA